MKSTRLPPPDKSNRQERDPMVAMLNDHLASVRDVLDAHLQGQAEALAALAMVLRTCLPPGAIEKGLRAQINATSNGSGVSHEVGTRLLRAMHRAVTDPRQPPLD